MNTSDNQNWEDQWRKEIDDHTPLSTTEDWYGMTRLLDCTVPANAQHIFEQEPTGPLQWPWLANTKALPKLPWWGWAGISMLVATLGLWLGSINGEIAYQKMATNIFTQDTFPPNYSLNRYWTFDQQGNRVGEMNSDTIWFDYALRRRGPHVLLSPGKVSDYRIDTVLHISGRGNLLAVRYDTVPPPVRVPGSLTIWGGRDDHQEHDDFAIDVVHVVDTTYWLDTLGNLTTRIARVDSIITYSPSVRDQ
ncbi:hypothetical protein [Neolewinella persica]|uniref:hypothetical protein n=1 Tax=Neolewinella persica TaxID=70998 RepID=UPI0003638D77|nr:hypothetical protein [Neolewinella persica]